MFTVQVGGCGGGRVGSEASAGFKGGWGWGGRGGGDQWSSHLLLQVILPQESSWPPDQRTGALNR
jgi:hypothetical protein